MTGQPPFDESENPGLLSTHWARLLVSIPGPEGSGLSYASYGLWEIDGVNVFGSRFVGGAMSFGVITSSLAMPTTGSASYTGTMVGFHSPGGNDPTRSYLSGSAALTANFAAGTVDASFTNITARDNFGESPGFAGGQTLLTNEFIAPHDKGFFRSAGNGAAG